jgi:protein-tyrosine kinase
VLGTIARIEGETRPEKLIVPKKPLSTIAEAYRVLRTNIRFSFVDRPMDALMVTSPGPGEGKSVTLANLAAVMAQSGLQVIAVDSDLRRPVLHKIFGVSNTEGLSDAVLNPDTEPADYLQETGIENLRLLPSGPLPPNPAELLGSDRMSAVLAALKAESDLLLFDSPPTLVVTDAAVLAAQIDGGLLLVVDAGRSRRGMVKRAAEELRRVRANLLGVIVNRLSVRGGGQYYYQYYYYYSDRYGKNQKRRKDRTGLQRLLPDFLVGSNGKDSAEEPVEEAAKEKS